MSVTPLADVKRAMRIIGTADDAFLQQLVDSAEDEALRFLNRTQLPTLPADNPGSYDSDGNPILNSEDIPSSEDPVAASIFTAIVCLVKADYEAAPEEIVPLRRAAETKLYPYRILLGI